LVYLLQNIKPKLSVLKHPVFRVVEEPFTLHSAVQAVVNEVACLGKSIRELGGSTEGTTLLEHVGGRTHSAIGGLVEDTGVVLDDLCERYKLGK
jgi:hypothetical protein